MAVTKKSKAKSSTANSSKAKTKAKNTKPVVKVKKSPAKDTKSKKTKITKVKKAQPKAPVKKAIAKTKVKTKPQSKPPAPTSTKTKIKAQVKIPAKAPKLIKPKDKITNKITTNVAVVEKHKTENFPTYEPQQLECYMDEKQLSHFKNILELWKRELMEEVDHTITEMKEAGVLADPNDCATQEETFSLELRTRDRERKLLKKIEEALQKIGDEEYGYCETCGIEIGVRRLEARPTATLCIDCKTLDEIKEKRS